jgi:hypothetical protein
MFPEVLDPDVNSIMSVGQNTIQCLYGLEDNASCCMRRVRAQVDTGDREPSELPIQAVSFNALEQRRHRRQDERGADQGRA